ncbi:MAG: SDR family oxidoreductase [Myxococcales bacterium]|nr:MAG: SDR family oxidoreductase [Myxococcales bacterium]
MQDFKGKLAVVTGGGTGMGRELVRQLAADGCSVAMCDISEAAMAETRALAEKEATGGARVTSHVANVSVEEQLTSFCREVAEQHGAAALNLLFNNAGIAGGGSFVAGSREEWERTFGTCWFGVYYGCRAFLPMLIAAEEAHIINTSSVNGFWAALGPGIPHTAYSAAKFAVKGFSEALIEDLRANAPHVKVSVVMPGHIGTEIVANTLEQQGVENLQGFAEGTPEEMATILAEVATRFRDDAPTTAAEAATVILDGVRKGRWRILVGDDAHELDREVRKAPEDAYDPTFRERLGLLSSL